MIAIIPARGGSKGLPGKNIKELAGKPLIAYTIEAAKQAKSISRVIISTDSPEIAKVAVEYGAECPFMRPAELATDSSLAIDTYLYTIARLEGEERVTINEIVVLQPTSPLRTATDIDDAVELFTTRNADSVISYCQEHRPVSWHRKLDKDGRILKNNTELKNRQDESVTYFPNGAIYILKKRLLEARNYYSENTYAYIMNRSNSIDIDTIDDFSLAEFMILNR